MEIILAGTSSSTLFFKYLSFPFRNLYYPLGIQDQHRTFSFGKPFSSTSRIARLNDTANFGLKIKHSSSEFLSPLANCGMALQTSANHMLSVIFASLKPDSLKRPSSQTRAQKGVNCAHSSALRYSRIFLLELGKEGISSHSKVTNRT